MNAAKLQSSRIKLYMFKINSADFIFSCILSKIITIHIKRTRPDLLSLRHVRHLLNFTFDLSSRVSMSVQLFNTKAQNMRYFYSKIQSVVSKCIHVRPLRSHRGCFVLVRTHISLNGRCLIMFSFSKWTAADFG